MINWKKHYKRSLFILGLVFFAGISAKAQEGDPNNGEKLFKANCTACHALDKQMIGPPLGGVVERLQKEQNIGTDWLHQWIKDNSKLRASSDKYANEVFKKFNQVPMTPFPNLSDKDIDDILAYTTNPPAPAADNTAETTQADKLAAENAQKDKLNSKIILISLASIALLLIWLLFKVKQYVKIQRSDAIQPLEATRIRTLSQWYAKYHFIGNSLLGILAIFAVYGVWNWLMWVGVYKGYKPEQPIYFSHKIHVGENKIDCQLCHSGAKYGKVSEIPSLNVCMNCHRTISEYNGKYVETGKDKAFYDSQIQKLYSHVGWAPEKQQSTGKSEPVEWVRIHNMPDFVYFNHSQHVVAGEEAIISSFNKKNPNQKIDVVCKACHGQIDTMNVVQMANDFTMGWCIECHRTTEVDMNNNYNKEYFEKLHEKLKKQYPKSEGKITVDAIGGLECGKCHY